MSKLTTLESLAILYDRTAHELREVVSLAAGGNTAIPLHGEQMKNKVQWLGDIAKTLSLVYQIEKLRNTTAAPEEMPAENIVADPALKNVKRNPANVVQDLSQFPGWKPFNQ